MEKINFKYQSIGNICRLFVTIQIEKSRNSRLITIFHKRFDNEKDDIFEEMLVKLFPNGVTVGEQEINQLVNFVIDFMEKDETAKKLFVEYDKKYYSSYVYSKVENKVYPAYCAAHLEIVINICRDFFKGFEKIDLDYLKQFIRENIEIKSDFSSIETICNNAEIIANEIIFY